MAIQQSAQKQDGKPQAGDVAVPGESERQRIDKWLWHARVVKTRTLAQKLVNGGKVRVNREKVLAVSALVKIGDVMTIAVASRVRVLRVAGFSERRGSATMAQALFEDLTVAPDQGASEAGAATGTGTASESGGEANDASRQHGGRDRHPEGHPGGQGVGRPSKHDRRKLADLKKIDVS